MPETTRGASKLFQGVYTALITPMHADGRVDEAALATIVEAQIEGGVHGLVPCGTTGESTTLSHAEHVRVVEEVVRRVAGRVPVLAGAGSNSTTEAIDLARACQDLGVTGTLQVVPYYNRPPQDGLVRHFEAIADAVALPMVVYNVPSRTACDLQAATVARLARHPNIVGIKEATADMHRAAQVRELCGPEFCLLSGDDFTMLPLWAVGGDGVISVVSNPAPRLVRDMWDAFAAGDLARARALNFRQLSLTRLLFAEPSPIPVKAAMHLLGLAGLEARSPLRPLDRESELFAKLRVALTELDLRPV
ncbi:4-hydroxy-tetrahydrodipicolinate synthase [Nannocystaceae bacterium ST9]